MLQMYDDALSLKSTSSIADRSERSQMNNEDDGGVYGSLGAKGLSQEFVSEPATLTFENLKVFTKGGGKSFFTRKPSSDRKQILKNVSGVVAPGQLVALMGASGSGKTTLLNVINSRNCKGLDVEGSIKVNGKEIGRDITSISAYVQQDDLFIGTMTVREHLIFQALVRLPKEMNRKEKIKRADQVIFDLGLSKCKNTKIGITGILKGISGGEQKRLAFASEILTNPSILFCDEPTTGLDSYMAQSVVSVLQNLANTGKTVLCTIHQPASEIYLMFDRIMFLAEGRIAYFGSSENALQFFSALRYPCPTDYNPADFFVHTLAVVPAREEECRQRINIICDNYDNSIHYEEVDKTIKDVTESESYYNQDEKKRIFTSRYKSSSWTQFKALMWRSTLNNLRNPKVFYIRFLQKVFMAIFVGLIYLNTTYNQEGIMNINGALFFILAEYSFPAIFGVITVLPAEFPVIVREHHNGMYRILIYYLSKIVAFIPSFSIDGIVFILIAYFMIGLQKSLSAFLLTALIGVLLEQAGSAFGTMLSAVAPKFSVAIAIVGPIMTVIEMTGGLFINIGTIPKYISWTQYVSWFRYGYEAMFIVQWQSVNNITCKNPQLSCLNSGDEILRKFNFHKENFNLDLIMMFVLFTTFHFIGYMGLWWRAYKAR